MKRTITILLMCVTAQVYSQCFQKTSASMNRSLAIKADGTLWTWGFNNFGQLGNNSTTDRRTPIHIGIANNWLSVEAGRHCSFAITNASILWGLGNQCWSANWRDTIYDVSPPKQITGHENWKIFLLEQDILSE